MKSSNYKNRHYAKGNYEAVLGTLFVGFIFFCFGFLGILMNMVGYQDSFVSLESWGQWMIIPGFFILVGGGSQYITNKNYQKTVVGAIYARGNKGSHNVDEISQEIGISSNKILKILLDLRNQGKILYRFDSSSGDIHLGEAIGQSRTESESQITNATRPNQSKARLGCQYCGFQVEQGSVFCEKCGSKL